MLKSELTQLLTEYPPEKKTFLDSSLPPAESKAITALRAILMYPGVSQLAIDTELPDKVLDPLCQDKSPIHILRLFPEIPAQFNF